MPCWDTDKGDIIINKKHIFKQIEVKGFMSIGPSSFGPTEKWDFLYFVDGQDIKNKKFKVYEVKLSNKNEFFRNINMSKKKHMEILLIVVEDPEGVFIKYLNLSLVVIVS
jgi:hypothetical protein